MSVRMKKVLAVLVILIVILGWAVTFMGAGSVPAIKDKIKLGLDIKGGVYVVMEAQTDATGDELKKLMEQTQAVIEQRVNQMGLSEPIVTVEGEKRIRVELPGAEDADAAIKQIGKTAQLQFFLADGTLVLDGGMVKNAETEQDKEHGGYAVKLEFDREGSDAFAQATRDALSGNVEAKMEGVSSRSIAIVLDNQIISAPVVNDVIANGTAVITSSQTGGYPQEEATTLAALIRGGSLPVELKEINTSTRTATIGYNAFELSVIAGAIGLGIIMVMMLVSYGIMGVAADIALLVYVLIDLWAMAGMGSVLTLPGIAGIILSIGMAVDANVIIFSRIREEISVGKSVRVAVNSGFRRALTTIIDSQITTIIAAVVLYQFGTGAVKGFAMTLMIGIFASIFTATVVTQLFLGLFADGKGTSKKSLYGVREDNTIKFAWKKKYSFIGNRKIYYIIAAVVIIGGILFGNIRGYNYGIDFTGGTMMQFDMGKQVQLAQVEKSLETAGINASDIVYSGEGNKEVIIRTTQSLDNAHRNTVIAQMNKDFGITEKSVLAVEQFGPSVGKELRNNAIKAVLIAAVGMLIYVIFRFEWRFGVASISGIIHDVLVVLALYGIFHITINSPFIAGILTVVGYSINDTIVVFDRIRENFGLMKKNQIEELIDTSINQTLSRSIMTSLTTLVVMIPLIVMTSDTIREFMVPLVMGVLVGTASSVFLCSPVYYQLYKATTASGYQAMVAKKSK